MSISDPYYDAVIIDPETPYQETGGTSVVDENEILDEISRIVGSRFNSEYCKFPYEPHLNITIRGAPVYRYQEFPNADLYREWCIPSSLISLEWQDKQEGIHFDLKQDCLFFGLVPIDYYQRKSVVRFEGYSWNPVAVVSSGQVRFSNIYPMSFVNIGNIIPEGVTAFEIPRALNAFSTDPSLADDKNKWFGDIDILNRMRLFSIASFAEAANEIIASPNAHPSPVFDFSGFTDNSNNLTKFHINGRRHNKFPGSFSPVEVRLLEKENVSGEAVTESLGVVDYRLLCNPITPGGKTLEAVHIDYTYSWKPTEVNGQLIYKLVTKKTGVDFYGINSYFKESAANSTVRNIRGARLGVVRGGLPGSGKNS